MRKSTQWRAALVCCVVAASSTATAQVIPVKTSRIAQGDLTGFLPSSLGGMGRLLGVTDTLAEAYDNPAAGARVRGTQVMAMPSFYDISRKSGGGSSLPVAVFRQRGRSFGSLMLALQDVSPPGGTIKPNVPDASRVVSSDAGFAARLAPNRYAFGTFGHATGAGSVGVGVRWSGLDAIDGAELLYPGVRSLRRTSNALDVRLGALREDSILTLEAVLLFSRSGATHEITSGDRVWDPAAQSFTERTWTDNDRDGIRRFGAHVAVTRPVDSLWRVSAVLTGNRIAHTRMPSMGAMNLERDPARATAINAGIGFARISGRTRLGMDAIYEPIRASGSITGVPNDDQYRFRNSILRGALSHDFLPDPVNKVRVEFGAEVHSIRFDVERPGTALVSHRSWNEWTHTWGISLLEEPFDLHLRGRIVSGVLRPGFDDQIVAFDAFPAVTCINCSSATASAQIVPIDGPWGPPAVQLRAVRVATTQFSISVPFR